jgi:hypothetical protein
MAIILNSIEIVVPMSIVDSVGRRGLCSLQWILLAAASDRASDSLGGDSINLPGVTEPDQGSGSEDGLHK